ncbi:hypothetical protein E1301_Tti016875 [Triplophysa tibetana]|uniref:Uncharacterized protein n=1 Tax=Triplophysa tibetana TaxID=1572043 RepID=A0A5A9NAF5_9TELE|nr:hypothetical protein E1301_Tti016875 [Triplophysa tibetana]
MRDLSVQMSDHQQHLPTGARPICKSIIMDGEDQMPSWSTICLGHSVHTGFTVHVPPHSRHTPLSRPECRGICPQNRSSRRCPLDVELEPFQASCGPREGSGLQKISVGRKDECLEMN